MLICLLLTWSQWCLFLQSHLHTTVLRFTYNKWKDENMGVGGRIYLQSTSKVIEVEGTMGALVCMDWQKRALETGWHKLQKFSPPVLEAGSPRCCFSWALPPWLADGIFLWSQVHLWCEQAPSFLSLLTVAGWIGLKFILVTSLNLNHLFKV